jgi:hypothetical protein
MNQCCDCHRQAERVRRARAATKRDRSRVAGALTRLREAQSDGQVRALCSEIVRRLGGVSAFMDAWTTVLHRDLRSGGYAAFRHFDAIVRLVQYCERNRPDYSRFTDEQLEVAIRALGGGRPPE